MRFALPVLILATVVGCHGELVPLEPAPGDDDDDIAPSVDAAPGIAFRPAIQSDLDDAGCTAANCHALLGTPMLVVEAPTEDTEWQSNYDEIVARSGNPDTSLLIAKPSGLGGHLTVLPPNSPVISRWKEWIADGVPYE